MKKVIHTNKSVSEHWVGDGFPVKSLFSYHADTDKTSPFLLFDYAGPKEFSPSNTPRGVGEHPHRGFETVTIVYDGAVTHGDSVGNKGTIGPGDVQWMTAASGIIHTEMHSDEFTKRGGNFEAVQLWVNLPAKHKMSPPKYQELLKTNIPVVQLDNNAGDLRVIAGEFNGQKGPANTFTPVNLWDVKMNKGASGEFKVPEGYTTLVAVLHGTVSISDSHEIDEATLAILDKKGNTFKVKAAEESKFLILNGKPIEEPVVGYGPFVMNRKDEIETALSDFQKGRFTQSAVRH